MNEPTSSNGRRTALIVIGVAFLASVTTVGLSFYASYGANGAAAHALAKDVNDLRGTLDDWWSHIADAERVPGGGGISVLESRVAALSAWKSRTPCGEQMRDRLRAEMQKREARIARVAAGQPAGDEPIDEKAALAAALHGCQNTTGRDVEI